MKKLLKTLDELWKNSDKRLQGENPACDKILGLIEDKIWVMNNEDIEKQLSGMSKYALSQILPVLENMVDKYPEVIKYIEEAMD